jgi:hypothetical protein
MKKTESRKSPDTVPLIKFAGNYFQSCKDEAYKCRIGSGLYCSKHTTTSKNIVLVLLYELVNKFFNLTFHILCYNLLQSRSRITLFSQSRRRM